MAWSLTLATISGRRVLVPITRFRSAKTVTVTRKRTRVRTKTVRSVTTTVAADALSGPFGRLAARETEQDVLEALPEGFVESPELEIYDPLEGEADEEVSTQHILAKRNLCNACPPSANLTRPEVGRVASGSRRWCCPTKRRTVTRVKTGRTATRFRTKTVFRTVKRTATVTVRQFLGVVRGQIFVGLAFSELENPT